VSAGLVLLNVGLFSWAPPAAGELLTRLQFDSEAVRAGELWRLLTFNLVHWTPRHFALNLAVFLGLGLIYERYFRRWYPWLLLLSGSAVGLGVWWWLPARALCRGLSGVVACQAAAALGVELVRARRDRSRWLWLAPALLLFVLWLVYKWYDSRTNGAGAGRPLRCP
jgi:membrane associated rhomboid family serine protease